MNNHTYNQMTRKRLMGTASVAAAFLLLMPEIAAAQTSGLDEIVVTATKRAESVQDIPIAISALGAKQLEETGFDGIEDLSFLVPSLQLGTFGPVTFLNIRGIGSENTTGGSDPGVALHVDGVYVGRPAGALFSSFDAERVEVLRGPQGTLYGRNATGGSVNLISKKPTDEFEGEADVTFGNFNRIRTRAAVNVPIADNVSARVVGFIEDRDGFTENTFEGGSEANDKDDWGVRGHLNFDINDNASLLLSANHIVSDGVGRKPEQRDPFVTGPLGGPPFLQPNLIQDGDGNFLVNNLEPFVETKNTIESQESDFTLLSATFDYDFGPVIFKSITGYVETSFISVQDNDQSAADIQTLTPEEDSTQFTQEFQLLSNNGSNFEWILGAFYFNEDVERFTSLTGGRFDNGRDFLAARVPGIDDEFLFRVGGVIESESYAVFAQGTYDITDDLSFTGGLRFTEDKKDGFNQNIQFGPLIEDEVQVRDNAVTGKAALDWQATDNALLYASFARGYKAGGVNQTTIASRANAIFEPEFVNSFEVGLKSRFADNRIQLNLAGYVSDYTDLQFQIFSPTGVQESGNAGAATIIGIEGELQAALTDSFNVDGSFGWTDAEYDDLLFNAATGVNLAGNTLPRVPDFTLNAGFTKNWDFSDGSNLRLRGEHSFTDEIFYEIFNGPESVADSYQNTNLRLFWTDKDDRFSVQGYVTNVFDTVQEGNVLVGFGLGTTAGETGQEFVSYNPPRQYGVQLGYKF